MDLDERLNNVDYSFFEKDYKPSQFALQFISFIKLVNGEDGEESKTPLIHYDMVDQLVYKRQNLFVSFRGSAKALALDTPIMTPTGNVPIGELEVGDTVFDRNGEKTKVTNVSEIFNNDTYTFKLSDGSTFIANEDHYHIVHVRTIKKVEGKNVNYFKEQELTTSEIIKRGVHYKRTVTKKCPYGKEVKWFIPLVSKEVDYDFKPTPMDPYTVGFILGDGNIATSSGMVSLTSEDKDFEECLSYIPYKHGIVYKDKRNTNTLTTRLHGLSKLVLTHIGDKTCLDKAIPSDYLYNSVEVRLELLRGLMDTDGTVSRKGRCSFTSASKSLAEGVFHIVKSLGANATIKRYENSFRGYYSVAFSLQNHNPFKLRRKADRWVSNTKYKAGPRVSILSIEKTPVPVPSRCISVASPTKSFLIENSVITRNTSVLHEYMFLYLAVYGKIPGFGTVNVGMYVSDTIDNGVKSMRTNLEFRWNNSEFLQKFVPDIRFTDVRWEFTNIDGKKLCIRGYAALTGVRGFKEYGQRPVWVGYDDLMSDKNAESPTITKDIKHIIYKAARQALHPKKRMQIWTGTPFNKSDPLYQAAESDAWNTRVYPICEKYPCKKEEFRGGWEDRFSYEFVRDEYKSLLASGEIASFNQELMLRITSDEERLIQENELVWYKRDTVLRNKSRYNFYITTDFATSDNSSSDYSVVVVWAYTHNGEWLLVDGLCKRQLMDENLNTLFRFASTYKPLGVGIEINGQQQGFIKWIKEQMVERNIFFNLEGKGKIEGIRRNKSKIENFRLVVPLIKAKKIWIPEELKESPLITELLEEIRFVTKEGFKSKHDDVCDNISMLLELDAYKPSEEMTKSYITDESGTFVIQDDFDDNDIYQNSTVF